MRHIVYYERFRGYRADVSCCTAKMYLACVIQTGRSGRICFFFNFLVVKFECKCGNLCGSVVVVRHYVIVNDLEIIDKIYYV